MALVSVADKVVIYYVTLSPLIFIAFIIFNYFFCYLFLNQSSIFGGPLPCLSIVVHV